MIHLTVHIPNTESHPRAEVYFLGLSNWSLARRSPVKRVWGLTYGVGCRDWGDAAVASILL